MKPNPNWHSWYNHGICIKIWKPWGNEYSNWSPKPCAFLEDNFLILWWCKLYNEEYFGENVYFIISFPICEIPMENIHWFWPETVKSANDGLCFISCAKIICLWNIYDQFRDMIQLLHDVGIGSIVWLYWLCCSFYFPLENVFVGETTIYMFLVWVCTLGKL